MLVQVRELMTQLRASRADPAIALLERSIAELDEEFLTKQRQVVSAQEQLRAMRHTTATLSAAVARHERVAAAQQRYARRRPHNNNSYVRSRFIDLRIR